PRLASSLCCAIVYGQASRLLAAAPLARLGARVAGVAGVANRNLLLDAALHHPAAVDLLRDRDALAHTASRLVGRLLLDAAGVGLGLLVRDALADRHLVRLAV